MRGEVKLPGRKGSVAKWCGRCGGKHAGGTTKCDLAIIYSPANQPQRLARRDAADKIEEYEDERDESKRQG